VWCHTPASPAAGIDLTRRTQSAATIRDIGIGVQLEMAPLVRRLDSTEKRVLLDWVQSQTGALPAVMIPSKVTWELAPLLAPLADGALAPGFAFVIEDGKIDPGAWRVATYRDRFGIAYRSIALDQTHVVSAVDFPPSRNPSSYFVFTGIPWHGRFHDMRLEGDVRFDRWMSVGMQAADMAPPGRSDREYVRLQFDRDAVSLRSAPTAFETWPWGGTSLAPGRDPKLAGTTDRSGFYLRNDEWFHFVLQARRVTGGVRWQATVTRRGTGAVVAQLDALQPSATPLAGTFFLHAYAAGGKRNWANLTFEASVDGGTSAVPAGPEPRRRRSAAEVTATR
jgi:hypothetical protein